MEDEILIEKALNGDDHALRTLHDRYVNQVFRFLYVQTSNYQDAEELLQDVFFKMARNLSSFQGNSSFKTWLFSISRNAVIDYYRKQKKYKDTFPMENKKMEYFADSTSSVDNEVAQSGLVGDVMNALLHLPTDYRAVLQLRLVEGYSIRDTADVMSKSTNAIKSLQHRARKQLLEIMGNEVTE